MIVSIKLLRGFVIDCVRIRLFPQSVKKHIYMGSSCLFQVLLVFYV